MLYCEKCREANKWPESVFMSHGKCEVCGTVGECNDVPSERLPLKTGNEDNASSKSDTKWANLEHNNKIENLWADFSRFVATIYFLERCLKEDDPMAEANAILKSWRERIVEAQQKYVASDAESFLMQIIGKTKSRWEAEYQDALNEFEAIFRNIIKTAIKEDEEQN